MRESVLFSHIDFERGYAVPTEQFWQLWAEKKDAVCRLGFQPPPYGDLVGSDSEWVVSLPRNREVKRYYGEQRIQNDSHTGGRYWSDAG